MSHLLALKQNPLVQANPAYAAQMDQLVALSLAQAPVGTEAENVVVKDINEYPVLAVLAGLGFVTVTDLPGGGHQVDVVEGEEDEGHDEHDSAKARDKHLANEDTTFAQSES